MNGKERNMDYKFAIRVLSSAKVDTQSMHGYPGCQNQNFYDIARQMAIQALKEKYEKNKPKTPGDVVEVVRCKKCGNFCKNTGECNMYGHHPGEDGYCSGAIPKEREKNEM